MKNLKNSFRLFALLAALLPATNNQQEGTPTVGFVDAFEDSTIDQPGSASWLPERGGFSEEEGRTMNLIYRNAIGRYSYR